jgi:hypothetical protein
MAGGGWEKQNGSVCPVPPTGSGQAADFRPAQRRSAVQAARLESGQPALPPVRPHGPRRQAPVGDDRHRGQDDPPASGGQPGFRWVHAQ